MLLGIEYIVNFPFLFVIDHYRRWGIVILARQGVFGSWSEQARMEHVVDPHGSR